MRKKGFLCLAIVVLLAACGCQQTEQRKESPENSMEEFLEQSSVEESVTELTEPEESNLTTGSSSTELPIQNPWETTAEKQVMEIEYDLDSELDVYYISNDRPGKSLPIDKVGDSYTITGDKFYGGPIVLSWEQKGLLDAGAELRIMYRGEEINRIKASIPERYSSGEWRYYVHYYYTQGIAYAYLITPNSDEWIAKEKIFPFISLESSPYNGIGFYLRDEFVFNYMPLCDIKLEAETVFEVSGDTIIEPYYYAARNFKDYEVGQEVRNKTWTFAEYYEEVVEKEMKRSSFLMVFEENGKIVRIIEVVTP